MGIRARRIRNFDRPISIARIHTALEKWSINFDTRKKLLEMDDRQLRDIGIDWADAEKEGNKPFWKD